MNEEQMQHIMTNSVATTCTELTTDELLAQYMATLTGVNPKPVMGYGKIAHLFTEQDGTRMRQETKAAFQRVAMHRLGI